MSHAALQRVVVRMLWDPEFVERVYATPLVALAGDDLESDEIAWLTQPDRRAWATDPARRARTLHGLLEEFPAAGALAARHERGLHVLDRFFSSTTFHACIRDGASLALAFGSYLAREAAAATTDSRIRALASVEGGVASLRRAPASPLLPAGRLALRARARLLDAPAGTAALLAEITRRLASAPGGPVAAIAAGTRSLTEALPALGPDHEITPLLAILDDAGAAALEEVSPALCAVLRFAASENGATPDDLCAIARRHGADPGEDREILDGLIADGLLVSRSTR